MGANGIRMVVEVTAGDLWMPVEAASEMPGSPDTRIQFRKSWALPASHEKSGAFFRSIKSTWAGSEIALGLRFVLQEFRNPAIFRSPHSVRPWAQAARLRLPRPAVPLCLTSAPYLLLVREERLGQLFLATWCVPEQQRRGAHRN